MLCTDRTSKSPNPVLNPYLGRKDRPWPVSFQAILYPSKAIHALGPPRDRPCRPPVATRQHLTSSQHKNTPPLAQPCTHN
eukprot:scaffold59119_cov49-Phaeocystis_antarctica.AAC.1